MKIFSAIVFIFGFVLSVLTLFISFSGQTYLHEDNFFRIVLLWILLLIYISFFKYRFSKSPRLHFFQMLIYFSLFTIFSIDYIFYLANNDYPFTKKYFPDGFHLSCPQVVSEKKNTTALENFNAVIDCENIKIEISRSEIKSMNRIHIKYSSLPIDFSFPHSSHEGFSILDEKVILPYLYLKFENFSFTGSNLFSNHNTCRRFNLETGVDELLWGCW